MKRRFLILLLFVGCKTPNVVPLLENELIFDYRPNGYMPLIVLYTELGKLSIKGEALNITKLEITELEGEVMIEGNINSLEYDKSRIKKKNESFISKLLG